MQSFAEILVAEREKYNQSPEGIAMHMRLPVEEYLAIEAGSLPTEATLKRFCAVFGWNFFDYRKYLISDSERYVQVSAVSSGAPGRGSGSGMTSPQVAPVVSSSQDIKALCEQIKTESDNLNLEAARIVSLQLSLIRRTIHHLRSE